jgi:2-polyprenyl-3-methyl-5-hydroxy-6-metoxy-1,4-benzoquinol methylase
VPSAQLHPIAGLVDRRQFLPRRAAGQAVVHLGCVDEGLTSDREGTGDLLHQELAATARSLVGVDISPDGLDVLRALVPGDYIEGDVLRLTELDLPESCDLVIAAELIEHLRAPSVFLEQLRTYLESTGATALLTTPNSYSWIHWWRFALTRAEDVHPDHLLLYSPTTLKTAIERAGLEIRNMWMHRWSRRGIGRIAARGADAVVLRWNPHLAVGFVIEVVPAR